MTDQDWEYLRRHREAVDQGINRQVARRGELIEAALVEEGADPDTVAAMASIRPPDHVTPIPEDIRARVARRAENGEFDGPVTIRIPQEDQ